MKHNNEFALSKVWTVKAFVVESPIVALFFCFCKHVFKGFVFIANGRQVLLTIYKRSCSI